MNISKEDNNKIFQTKNYIPISKDEIKKKKTLINNCIKKYKKR